MEDTKNSREPFMPQVHRFCFLYFSLGGTAVFTLNYIGHILNIVEVTIATSMIVGATVARTSLKKGIQIRNIATPRNIAYSYGCIFIFSVIISLIHAPSTDKLRLFAVAVFLAFVQELLVLFSSYLYAILRTRHLESE